MPNLVPGATLGRRYRVESILGHGAMSLVVAARHIALGQRVAVKVFNAMRPPRECSLRFVREAQIAVRIQSDHVCRILDLDRLDDGTPFMVMEYLEGADLKRVLKQRGPLSTAEACDLVLQCCEGVAVAHQSGIVHRDIKPANLFLTRRIDGEPWMKVLDFGVSKLCDGGDRLTGSETLLGSPLYMAPEQLRSAGDADHRSDIWSLGAVLYELVSGVHAFAAPTLPEVCARVIYGTPVRSPRPLTPALLALISSCLEKDPDRRPQSLIELSRGLQAFTPRDTSGSAAFIGRLLDPPFQPWLGKTQPLRPIA
jgi:serine/threonine-protein kinase